MTHKDIYQQILNHSYLSEKGHEMLGTEQQIERAFNRMVSNGMPPEKAKELLLYIWGVTDIQPAIGES